MYRAAFFASLALPLFAATETPTFTRDIAPILFNNCTSCHRPGEIGPMPLTSYKEIRPWAKAIQASVQTRKMPPWHADPHYGKFANDSRLKDSDVALITAWAKAGAPEGDPKLLPALPQFAEGWQIGKPDAIYSIPEFTLSNSGYDEQMNFVVETNLKEDVWVEAIEIRPGNRKVVHHAHVWLESATPAAPKPKAASTTPRVSYTMREGTRAFARPDAPVIDDGCSHPNGGMWPGASPSELGSILASFVPGKAPEQWPTGIAKKIPAGSKLKFTIHYSKTTGKEEKDITSVGLRFAKQPPTQELRRIDLHNTAFLIPANDENHVVTACYTFQEDADVLSYLAHMHYRGKSMKFEAIYPDGRMETLIDIPKYDFEWQTKYLNATPVRIPKGTRIKLTATFDNSPNNRYNPDPSKVIRWGDNTVDEMMDGWFEFVTPKTQ
ncbi:c-type cytochrome [Bryobacter aggregatus]|uniref:c-type cytochrome n=1 Tax=Bryobacter aggregatus TaxID=360054 RepID=UPI00068FD98D|nr:cytochrome c [Bryobacter aggregatus]